MHDCMEGLYTGQVTVGDEVLGHRIPDHCILVS